MPSALPAGLDAMRTWRAPIAGLPLWSALPGGHIHHLQHVCKGHIRYGEPACLNLEALLLRCAALPRDRLDQRALQQVQHEIRMMWR